MMRHVDLGIIVLFFGTTMVWTLSLEPNHDKPCIVGDAWAEECMSCICVVGQVASCRPTFCASKLTRALDNCMEGETTKVACNTCVCKKNKLVCTKKHCPHVTS